MYLIFIYLIFWLLKNHTFLRHHVRLGKSEIIPNIFTIKKNTEIMFNYERLKYRLRHKERSIWKKMGPFDWIYGKLKTSQIYCFNCFIAKQFMMLCILHTIYCIPVSYTLHYVYMYIAWPWLLGTQQNKQKFLKNLDY